jgi:hypothetical protein
MTQGQDSYVYVGGKINRFFIPSSGETVTIPEGIGAYSAYVTYEAAGVNIKTAVRIAPPSSQTGSNPQPPIELFRLYPWLIGSKDNAYTITLHFDAITKVGGGDIPQSADVTKTFRRGDANNSGLVTITDALFIAQYLAGLRTLGEATDQVSPLNAATPRNDSTTAGSSITITDALYIAQMLAGLRDGFYN